jgi:hypothetical protein
MAMAALHPRQRFSLHPSAFNLSWYTPLMPMIRDKAKVDRGRDTPSVRQVTVFTENRVGALAKLVGTFDDTTVKILALAVIQGFDCAIVRFVFNDTDKAAKLLVESDYRFTICELVAVEMPPDGHGLLQLSKSLLSAEIDLHYCYALITNPKSQSAVVIHVDNVATATSVLGESGFWLLDENDLRN